MHKAIVMLCLFKNKNSIKNTGTKKTSKIALERFS